MRILESYQYINTGGRLSLVSQCIPSMQLSYPPPRSLVVRLTMSPQHLTIQPSQVCLVTQSHYSFSPSHSAGAFFFSLFYPAIYLDT